MRAIHMLGLTLQRRRHCQSSDVDWRHTSSTNHILIFWSDISVDTFSWHPQFGLQWRYLGHFKHNWTEQNWTELGLLMSLKPLTLSELIIYQCIRQFFTQSSTQWMDGYTPKMYKIWAVVPRRRCEHGHPSRLGWSWWHFCWAEDASTSVWHYASRWTWWAVQTTLPT